MMNNSVLQEWYERAEATTYEIKEVEADAYDIADRLEDAIAEVRDVASAIHNTADDEVWDIRKELQNLDTGEPGKVNDIEDRVSSVEYRLRSLSDQVWELASVIEGISVDVSNAVYTIGILSDTLTDVLNDIKEELDERCSEEGE